MKNNNTSNLLFICFSFLHFIFYIFEKAQNSFHFCIMNNNTQVSKNTQRITRKHGKIIKHKFTPEDDKKLSELVHEFGENCWEDIAEQMGDRNPRQCKDRWTRYLSPNVNKNKWTVEEEKLLIKLVKELNFKWVQIAKHFKGRTDNQIKNKWNILKKYVNIKKKSRNSSPTLQMDKKLKAIPPKEEKSEVETAKEIDKEQKDQSDVSFVNFLSHIDSGYLEQMFQNEENQDLFQLFGF